MTVNRRGLALPVAVFTIVIIVLFIAGSAFTTSQEARASTGSLAERMALESAEYGGAAVFRDWKPAWNVSVAIGQTIGPFTHSLRGGSATVRVTRTSLTNWWIVSEGTAGTATTRWSRRTVNAAVRLNLWPGAPDAALSVLDSARITGTGMVIGTDSSSSLSGICASLTSAATAGVAAPDTTRVSGQAGIIGTPPLALDTTLTARFTAIDSAAIATLMLPAGAVITPAPLVTAGACDTIAIANWGDPTGAGPCGHHFPVIRALGDVTVRGGSGQGILIAGGDVTFENGATFHGLVMAHDDFLTGSGGGSVFGAVLAADARRAPGDQTFVGDRGEVRRSPCRLLQARLGAAAPLRVKQRWWAEFE
jgi:hypothetical protein